MATPYGMSLTLILILTIARTAPTEQSLKTESDGW